MGYLVSPAALYHMLNHSLNKSLMFFGAGNVMRSFGTKEIAPDSQRLGRLSGPGELMAWQAPPRLPEHRHLAYS